MYQEIKIAVYKLMGIAEVMSLQFGNKELNDRVEQHILRLMNLLEENNTSVSSETSNPDWVK